MEDEKCLVELDEIFKYIKHEDLIKIPYEIRQAIHEKKDNEYIWNYDESKALDEQNINRKTVAMLSYLNMEYLLNEEQKAVMEELHKSNEEKKELEKRKKYDPSNIFKDNTQNVGNEINEVNYENKTKLNEDHDNMKMITLKEDKWYRKIIKAIANIFHKNK
jgi:hypothetical protein